MTSTVSNLTPLGDSKNEGTLFTLPREIRDEIYRLLVKGRYFILRRCKSRHKAEVIETGTRPDQPDFEILQLSKTISAEAQEILYSESIFVFCVPWKTSALLKSPVEAVNRMKNIEIHIYDLSESYYNFRYGIAEVDGRIEAIYEAIVNELKGAKICRDTLYINLRGSTPKMIRPLRSHLLPNVCEFIGFRKIVMKVVPQGCFRDLMSRERSEETASSGEITAQFERVKHAITDAMEPTLGPASIRDIGLSFYIEFHPRQYMPAIFRAEAQRLMLEADRLEQVG